MKTQPLEFHRTVFLAGGSHAITLPTQFVEYCKVQRKDKVLLKWNIETGQLSVIVGEQSA